MAQRITDKLVKDLVPPATGNRITYDDKIKGFGIRITAAGTKRGETHHAELPADSLR